RRPMGSVTLFSSTALLSRTAYRLPLLFRGLGQSWVRKRVTTAHTKLDNSVLSASYCTQPVLRGTRSSEATGADFPDSRRLSGRFRQRKTDQARSGYVPNSRGSSCADLPWPADESGRSCYRPSGGWSSGAGLPIACSAAKFY